MSSTPSTSPTPGTTVTFNKAIPPEFQTFLTLVVSSPTGTTELRMSDATLSSGNRVAKWTNSGLWSAGATVQLKMTQDPFSDVTIWTSTLSLAAGNTLCTDNVSSVACSSSLSDNTITFRGVDYRITTMSSTPSTSPTPGTTVTFNKAIPAKLRSALTIFHAGTTELRMSDATLSSGNRVAKWTNSGLWSAGATVQLKMTQFAHVDAHLSALTAESSTDGSTFTSLDIGAFDAHQTSYSATVPYPVTHVKLTPTVNQSDAKVTVNTAAVTSGSASAAITLSEGDNTVTVRVTAEDGTTTRDYTVTIKRAAPVITLSGLTATKSNDNSTYSSLDIGTFDADTTSYSATVPFLTPYVKLTPTVSETTSTVTIKGIAATSGTASSAITLNVGDNPITVRVTGGDGTSTRDYFVTIKRSAPDISLAVSTSTDGGTNFDGTATLMPAFTPDDTKYTVAVPGVSHVKVMPTANNPSSATFTVDGTSVASGSPSAAIGTTPGTPKTVSVAVSATAQDGAFTRTYTIDVVAGHAALIAVAPNPVGEGQTAQITVSITAAQSSAISIPIAVSAVSAELADYSAPSSIRIAAGAKTGTGTLRTRHDPDAADETLTVALGSNLPADLNPGSPSSLTVTIDDDEFTSQVWIKRTSPNPVGEGKTTSITLGINPPQPRAMTIPLTLTNVSSESNDYSVLRSITIGAGQSEGVGRIRANHDPDAENEQFRVALGSTLPLLATAGSPSSATITIDDDEFTSQVSITGTSPNPVGEGETTTITLGINPVQPRAITIPLTLTNVSSESNDYSSLRSITISAGQSEGVGRIRANHDADAENEQFRVALGTLPLLATAGSTTSATVTIDDDEFTSAVSIKQTSPNPVAEGETVSVTLAIDPVQPRAITIPLTFKNGTSESNDYSALRSITIGAGKAEGVGQFRTNHDPDAEDEEFTVALGDNLPVLATAGTTSSATVTIDDDEFTSAVSITGTSPDPVAEGETVTVTLGIDPVQPNSITVPLTLSNVSAESNDYSALRSITISAGQSEGVGRIRTNHDPDADDEEFTVALGSSLPVLATAGTTTSATVTIDDDEFTSQVSITGTSPNPVGEGETVTITLGINPVQPRAITVPLTFTNGSAESNDYSALRSITISAGQSEGVGQFRTNHDPDADDEEFTVAAGSHLLTTAGTPSSATVTIDDDEFTSQVQIERVLPETVVEGETVYVALGISPAQPNRMVIPVTLTHDTSEAGDFSSLTSITINPGQPEGVGQIRANQDSDLEDERFTVALGNLPLLATAGATTSRAVAIEDDDDTVQPRQKPGPPRFQPGDGSLEVTWFISEDHSPHTGFDVEYRVKGTTAWSSSAVSVTLNEGTVIHTVGGLSNGTTYEVRVRARNSAGTGPWSWTREGAPAAPPPAPTISSVQPSAEYGFQSLDVTWSAVPSATAYNLRFRQTGARAWHRWGSTLSGDRWHSLYTTSERIFDLRVGNDTTYEVQVRALIGKSVGPWSGSVQGTTDPPTRTDPPTQGSPSEGGDYRQPWNIQVIPGNGQLTVTWNISPREGYEDSEIWHVLRWSQEFGVWANPRDPRAVGKNDGLSVDPGVTSYTITGLENGVATGVFIRSMVGHRNNMSERSGDSSQWVRTKGMHTTPFAPLNDDPTVESAIADAVIVNESGTHQAALTGVFSDADGDYLTITARSSDTAVATVSVAADQSSLTVTAKKRGTATITVTAADDYGGSVEDAFTVTVKAAPVVASAIADVTGLEIGDTRSPSLSGVFSDADGDAITVTQVASSDTSKVSVLAAMTTAADGSIVITGFTLTAADSGTATVTVSARDSDGNTVSDAFDVTVDAPEQQKKANSAPTVAGAVSDATIVNESGTSQVSLSGVFTDADNDSLTITAKSSDEKVATVSVSTDQTSLTVTAKKRGTATITVTAKDGNGGSVDDAFDVKVKAAPVVASAIDDLDELTLDSLPDAIDLSKVFSDADGDTLTFDASSTDDDVAWGMTFQGMLNVVPNAAGTATFKVTARDSDGNTVTDEFDVTVNAAQAQQQPANNAPTVASAIDDATIVNEKGTKQVSLSGVFTDADSDSLTVTAGSSDEKVATVSVSTDQTSLTVTAKKRGTATITVTANDGNGGSVKDSFTVTVKAAPVVASALADVTGLDIGDTRTPSLSGVFSDADGDAIAVTQVQSSDTSKVSVLSSITTAADGSISITGFTLTAEDSGTATITVTAQDADGNTVSDAFDVTVNAPEPQKKANSAPTVASAIDDATIVNESGTHEVSLSGVFADADEDSLTITAESSSTSVATVSVAADYSEVTVSAQGSGTATITVTANDGQGGKVSDTFDVKVKSAPVIAKSMPDVEVKALSDLSVELSGVFRDADGDALTITADNTDFEVITVFPPFPGWPLTVVAVKKGTDTVTVTAEDSDGNTVSDSFDVTVIDPPGPVGNMSLSATHDSVNVSWDAPTTGGAVDGYIVRIVRKGGGGDGAVKRPGSDQTAVTFGGLNSGTTYEVWVRAQNADGKGDRVHAEITLPEALPGVVTNLSVALADSGAGNVTVSWDAPEDGGAPDGYIVHIKPEDGGKGKTKTPKAKKTKVTFENLEAGQTYQVWVRAQNDAGKGERIHATITLPEEGDGQIG